MNKLEAVYREILFQSIEKKNRKFTQAALSQKLKLSLSTINKAVTTLAAMGAVEVHLRNFYVIDLKKVLYYWASIRNLQKDIVYFTRVEMPVVEIEKMMPNNIVFGGYTAYKFLFDYVPADYSEVYVYGDSALLKKRFPEKKGTPNLFVLNADAFLFTYGKTTTIANTFVDLWNMKEWYAKEFLTALEAKLHGILE